MARISRSSGEFGFAGIEGAYKAVRAGKHATGLTILLRWAAFVAILTVAVYVTGCWVVTSW